MKPVLILIALCIYVTASGQLAFEEITSPKDFAMDAIRKSPTGEYFVQGINFNDTIFTSTDGHTWTTTVLPSAVTITNMQFFSDGTPVLNSTGFDNLVRRNGTWYTLQPLPNQTTDNSFVKDDTLFTFQENTFFYSLDKGESFIEAFDYDEPVNQLYTSVWKFDHHYVLLTYFESEYFLSVFDQHGTRVLHQELALFQPYALYHPCGEVTIYDHLNYYRLNQSLHLTHGPVTEILPPSVREYALGSANDYYFARLDDVLYLSAGCNNDWEIAAVHDDIKRNEYMWIGPEGEIYLYNALSDHYVLADVTQNTWTPQPLDIDWPHLTAINESRMYNQVVVSTNHLFSRHRDEPAWIELDSSGYLYNSVQYSPDGDLYVRGESNILHSKDNGITFSTIPYPTAHPPFGSLSNIFVLDNDVLFYYNDVFGETYYTLDNGANWINADLPFIGYEPKVKRVRNDIVIAGSKSEFGVSHINMITGEVTTVIENAYSNSVFTDIAILDDGTIYVSLTDNAGSEAILLRYRAESGFEVASTNPSVANIYPLLASGNNLYGFEFDKYYWYSGDSLYTFALEGLPAEGARQFFMTESEHLFVIVNERQIFRSVEPLSTTKHLSGRLYYDHPQDCLADTLDPTLTSWIVTASNAHFVRVKTTDTEGGYNFDLPDGNYTVSVRPPSHHWDVCTASHPVVLDSNHASVTQDFQAMALSQCAYLELDFSTALLRRCFENSYTIRVRNTGPQASLGTTLRLQLDPYFEFLSSTLQPIEVNNHVYTFDLGVLELNDEVTFRIVFRLSCDAPLGLEHCMEGTLFDDNLCGERSYYKECQVNIGSYDPNDKRVFNETGYETDRVDKGEYIYYHIRFQNTGTDTAFNVRINDPLSSMLDYFTIDVLSASHQYSFELTDGPALSIFFPNIMLPDSNTNEPASHGFFKFRIKPLPEFDYGTIIPNTAGIYFDFNDPVLTNTVSTVILPTVKTIEPTALIDFAIFPNPANTIIQLTMEAHDRERVDECEVIDLFGRQLMKFKTLHDNAMDISHLTPGIYTVVLRENDVVIGMKKFVRM